jgi:hypothetical protein
MPGPPCDSGETFQEKVLTRYGSSGLSSRAISSSRHRNEYKSYKSMSRIKVWNFSSMIETMLFFSRSR